MNSACVPLTGSQHPSISTSQRLNHDRKQEGPEFRTQRESLFMAQPRGPEPEDVGCVIVALCHSSALHSTLHASKQRTESVCGFIDRKKALSG
ncbi:hypothetical protein AOLI_G00184320 [Acnodon oligacanthus]